MILDKAYLNPNGGPRLDSDEQIIFRVPQVRLMLLLIVGLPLWALVVAHAFIWLTAVLESGFGCHLSFIPYVANKVLVPVRDVGSYLVVAQLN